MTSSYESPTDTTPDSTAETAGHDSTLLPLSLRMANDYDWLFEGAPDDDVTVDLKGSLVKEFKQLLNDAGIADVPFPNATDDELTEFFAVHANFDLTALHLSDLARRPRIQILPRFILPLP